MLRWNSKLGTFEAADLPAYWINSSSKESLKNLVATAKDSESYEDPFQSESCDNCELLDSQLRQDIFKLKCDIFRAGETSECLDDSSLRKVSSSERDHIRRARAAVNPFEQIGRSIFINRAAVKLASIDAALGFIFSENNPQLNNTGQCCHFADLCGGPGGFSEYLLWRFASSSPPLPKIKGFGLTLRGRQDDFQQTNWWSLQSIPAYSKGLPFEAVYGPDGDSDGDITKKENRQAFINAVLHEVPGGCGIVLADGGFDMSGREAHQEHLISKLLAHEFACALPLLASGGHFMCKLFDIATPTTATLLYVLSTCFEKLTIIKPVTSRPANGERYVVGVGFLCQDKTLLNEIVSLLTRIGDAIDKDENSHGDTALRGCLPFSSIPPEFIVFLRNLNNELATRQKSALVELLAETRDPTKMSAFASNLTPACAISVANQCSKLWRLPQTAGQHQLITSSSTATHTTSTYRPSGLSSGGAVMRNTNNTTGAFSSSGAHSSDWRVQKKPLTQQISLPAAPLSSSSSSQSRPNSSSFFGSSTNYNGQWKQRGNSTIGSGLADSVSNWRRPSSSN